MESHPFVLQGSAGMPVRADVHLPDGDAEGLPVVIAVHGFKGFRKWGFWPAMARAFTAAGMAFVGFDMSHNGVGEGGLEFDQEALFEANTWAREEHDLSVVVDAVAGAEIPRAHRIDTSTIALLGHSRGGGLVIVHAADDRRIGAVAALAPVATILRHSRGDLVRGIEVGHIPILNTRTGQVLRLGADAIREILARDDLHDIPRHYAARLSVPLLVVHGEDDPAVPADMGRRLAEAAPQGTFVPVAACDHVLNCRHPLERETAELRAFLGRATVFVTDALS